MHGLNPIRSIVFGLLMLATSAAWCAPPPVSGADATIVDARDAARKRDRNRLAAARAVAQAAQHPLLPWVEYWDLGSRLKDASVDEVEAFYERWRGTYVEDRLRNDWLQELGRRRDWTALARDYPRFRMNDDREVACYWLFTEHLAGRDVRDAARAAWLAQRDLDDGCQLLATAMVDAKRLSADDVWRKARSAVEANRPAAAKAAVGLLASMPTTAPGNTLAADAAEAIDNPIRFVRRPASAVHAQQELRLLAILRLAANDTDVASAQLEGKPAPAALPAPLAAQAWAYTGRQLALKLSPDAALAAFAYQRAWSLLPHSHAAAPGWSDDTLAWGVRAALRLPRAAERWPLVHKLIQAMSANEQREPAWIYWQARAQLATAPAGEHGQAQRAEARRQLESIAGPLGFYQQLASEDVGFKPALPLPPLASSEAERDAARALPGLQRALKLSALDLRDEARREWNFTLRGMGDSELLAAARLACDVGDWQLCINTAERTRNEIDVGLRYPMPFAGEINQAAAAAGLEPAFVFGLIRQETRFMPQLRSAVGASGLMQLMPATARWMAKKIGLDSFRPEQVLEPAINLKLGTGYLKMVLDDLGGSQAMAAAAYNAGPSRPRRWREGASVEAAIWAENVPFNETRDYVKKVLSNAAVYAALLSLQTPVLKPRLGGPIGPRDAAALPANTELP